MAAFQAALKAGVTMIELDVMLSRDRKMVVIHDETLERTTDGTGTVADFTLAELQRLDAGSWFDSKYSSQRIPELGEVLELVKGRAYVNIEIKSSAYESHHPSDAIEKQVVELLQQKKLQGVCIISSFDANILEQLALMQNPPAIAYISAKPADSKTVQMCTRLNTFSWHPDQRIVTQGQVNQMHAAGIKVFPYKVNSLENFTKMRRMKVDGVITNDPARAGVWSSTKMAA